jgi:hypothetical protein
MMGNVGRREFVQGVGLVVGALAATAGYPPALAQLTTNVGSKPMTYEIKPLSFDPKNIKGLSEKLLLSHYENNYSGAVKRLNMDLLRESGEFPVSDEELDDTATTVYEGICGRSGPPSANQRSNAARDRR